MDVYSVEKRPGNFIYIFGHGAGGASAFQRRMPEISAGTGVHRADQHKIRGISEGSFDSAYSDVPVFHRLSQRFEYLYGEFRQFVEKKNSVMRERYCPGSGDGSSSDKSGYRYSLIRFYERADCDQGSLRG